jgi:phage replication O-like protein O
VFPEMASPRVKNGYTPVANELLEALAKTRIPGEAMQIFLVILRLTDGFHKRQDYISLSQFYLATGIAKKPSIIRAIKVLESINIINKNANGKSTTYSINKDYSTWKPLAKKLTLAKKLKNVSEKAKKRLLKSYPQKIKEKRNIEISYKLSTLLFRNILQNNPNSRLYHCGDGRREKMIREWADDIDKLIKIEKQKPELIEKIIDFATSDSFWKSIVLSGKKLRQKWDSLTLQLFEQKKVNLADHYERIKPD